MARGVVRAWYGENAPRRVVRLAQHTKRPRFKISAPVWLRRREPGPSRQIAEDERDDLPENEPSGEELATIDRPGAEPTEVDVLTETDERSDEGVH